MALRSNFDPSYLQVRPTVVTKKKKKKKKQNRLIKWTMCKSTIK